MTEKVLTTKGKKRSPLNFCDMQGEPQEFANNVGSLALRSI